jgi:hypothetical protein
MDYLKTLTTRDDVRMPWHNIKRWQPFKLDALGLVTLLGEKEVDQSLGQLQRRKYTEFLPLLAAFVVAGDRFNDEQAGFALYNISDAILTTELKGWFTRWLSSQKIKNGTSIFRWRVADTPQHSPARQFVAPVISFLCVAPMLACTIVIGDWFGIGNSMAIIASIFVRVILLWQRRTAINKVATKGREPASHSTGRSVAPKIGPQPLRGEVKKLLVTRADGKLVTIFVEKSILLTFVKDSVPPYPALYHFSRWVGWAAFGAHIVVLGMSSLFTQLYTVFLLVAGTWIYTNDFSWDLGKRFTTRLSESGTPSEFIETAFTSSIIVEQENPSDQQPLQDRRLSAYVRIEPDADQEDMMRHWSLLPVKKESSRSWYDGYEETKEFYAQAKRKTAESPDAKGSSVVSVASSEPAVISAEATSEAKTG